MQPTRLQLMQDHVRAIHRAVTGSDPPEAQESGETPEWDAVSRRFVELEAMARSIPPIAERVPPFSFAPPLDVIGTERELIVELGVPGIDRADVELEAEGDTLVVSGALPTGRTDGRIYFHAELPRGPFRRLVRLPEPTAGAPRVEVEQGIIRVRVAKAQKSQLPRA